MSLNEAQEICSEAMDDILACFKPGAKITVAVRTPGKPDADFMMTNDDPREALALIERRLSA